MSTKTTVLVKANKQNILMDSLTKFYKQGDNMGQLLEILNTGSKVSLRIVDWFVTNYSKKKNISYFLTNKYKVSNQFIVYIDYKLQLKGYSKKQFDPFCRRNRLNFYYTDDKCITTTVGQLNFFKWAISNDIIKYIKLNLKEIELDMNNSYKAVYNVGKNELKQRRKRQELSLSATRTVNKHRVKITVMFD